MRGLHLKKAIGPGSFLLWLIVLLVMAHMYPPPDLDGVSATRVTRRWLPWGTSSGSDLSARLDTSACPVPTDPSTGFPILSFVDFPSRSERPKDLNAYISERSKQPGCRNNTGRDFVKDPIYVHTSFGQSLHYVGTACPRCRECDLPCAYASSGGASGAADGRMGRTPDSSHVGWTKECPKQINIVQSMESPETYPAASVKGFKGAGWDMISSLEQASDVPIPYVSWQDYNLYDKVYPKTADALLAYFISNCGASNQRLKIVNDLAANGVTTHSFGGCQRNQEIPADIRAKNRGRITEKVMTLSRYKFYFAAENTNVLDYITEKVYEGLTAGTVPIYMGSPNIRDYMPDHKAVILVDDFPSVKELAEYLKYLDKNDTAYEEHLAWKSTKYEAPLGSAARNFKRFINTNNIHSACRICIAVADRLRHAEGGSTAQAPLPPDFEFFNSSGKCPEKARSYNATVFHVRERGFFFFKTVPVTSPVTLDELRFQIERAFGVEKDKLEVLHRLWPEPKELVWHATNGLGPAFDPGAFYAASAAGEYLELEATFDEPIPV
eukprot:tig00022075_g23627.t1